MLKGILPMIVVALIISTCASVPDYYTEQEEELPSSIEEEWSSIPLPSLGNVELTRAEIQQTDEGEPESLDLYYAQEKREELQSFFQDASNRSGFENENQVQLLYGSYSKQVDVFVSFQEDTGIVEQNFDDELTIQDTPVFYQEQDEGASYTFNTEQGQYNVSFQSNEYHSEGEREEIKAFLQNH